MASKSTNTVVGRRDAIDLLLQNVLSTNNVVEAVQRLDANDITDLFLVDPITMRATVGDEGAKSLSNSLIKNTSLTP